MPVTVVALKRRAGRILHLASGLQIALSVQVSKKGPHAYLIEPGSECLEFAAQRLGGSSGDTTPLKNALRRSRSTRALTEAAVKQSDARRQEEIKSLRDRIATLERAEKTGADLAKALQETEAAFKETRQRLRAADAAAKRDVSARDEEVRALKARIVTLERALKKQTATRETNKSAIVQQREPEPPTSPSTGVEDEASAPLSIVRA
jgi:chromosome segregation ATPase